MAPPQDPATASPPKPSPAPSGEKDFQDCLPCKIVGGTAFIGLGLYVEYSWAEYLKTEKVEKVIRANRLRTLGVHGTALTFMGLGVYRFFM